MAKFKSVDSPNATLAPQARRARASAEILNYVTLAPQARPSGEILNYVTLTPQARQARASGDNLN